jgi:hypothetical protein
MDRAGWNGGRAHRRPPLRERPLRVPKGPFSRTPLPGWEGRCHAALLSPPNRLRSREKNREYKKETESKGEVRHVMDAELVIESGVERELSGHFGFVNSESLTRPARALSSRPCFAPPASSLAAPSTLLVGGFRAWEKESAPSSARRADERPLSSTRWEGPLPFRLRRRQRSHRHEAHATRRFVPHLTVARAAMSRPLHHSDARTDHANTTAPHGDTRPAPRRNDDHASDRPPAPTTFPASVTAISQADGDA